MCVSVYTVGARHTEQMALLLKPEPVPDVNYQLPTDVCTVLKQETTRRRGARDSPRPPTILRSADTPKTAQSKIKIKDTAHVVRVASDVDPHKVLRHQPSRYD